MKAPNRHSVVGRMFLITTAFQEGDHTFIIVPKCEKDPPMIEGCLVLKLSEFYATREAATKQPADAGGKATHETR